MIKAQRTFLSITIAFLLFSSTFLLADQSA
ncbi:MAG: hypothetical protein QOH70_988, partial [Blastocatellia bacterium]|nr:hypothetical protein [Blastocatellia bacterium]